MNVKQNLNIKLILKTLHGVLLTMFFIVPVPSQVDVTAPAIQTVGQSLIVRCSVITVRGITSRVDVVWSSNGVDLETVEANVSSITNDSVEYTAYYTIVQLNETDDGRVYQCKVVINASPPVIAENSVTLNTTSKCSYHALVYVYTCVYYTLLKGCICI